MITVDEALQILREHAVLTTPALLQLQDAAGLVLAEDVFAPRNIPAFRQSAMDGYAFSYEAWKKYGQLQVLGEVAAGAAVVPDVQEQQAVRIFTGAPLPDGADTVVMQEKTIVDVLQLTIADDKLQPGGNVRPIGSEARSGELVLRKGARLTPAAIGFLATMGIAGIRVFAHPRIHIIVTGDELQTPGRPLLGAQVYEANSASLLAVLKQLHFTSVGVQHIKDNPEQLRLAFAAALECADVVLTTGGVSVGDYDFVTGALSACGVNTLFHRIKQKPGKPLYAGRLRDTLVFGLPGNPSSVLTCFYKYVQPVLQWKMGLTIPAAKKMRLTHDFTKPAGLTHFLKGFCTGTEVTLLTGQESYKLNTFAIANCLVTLEQEGQVYKVGDEVNVELIN